MEDKAEDNSVVESATSSDENENENENGKKASLRCDGGDERRNRCSRRTNRTDIWSTSILRVLGRGGMSVVYEAVHVDIGQRALKLLHPALATQVGYRERFFREALAASKVQHPGLVRVSDFGEHSDGTLYLLMEFLEGPTLRELLEQTEGNRLPIALSLYIGLQLAVHWPARTSRSDSL